MASPHEQKEFESWYRALLAKALTPKQLMVLKNMIAEGQANSLAGAAQLLDWQETVIDPDEHMYGH